MLRPAPVGAGLAGKSGTRRKAVELVVGIIGLGKPVLVPHGVGHHGIKGLESSALAKLGVLERIADLKLGLHVVDDGVHIGHRPGAGYVFLSIELERGVLFLAFGTHPLVECNLALDEQAAAAAAGVVHFLSWRALQHTGHDLAHFAGGVKLSGALSAAFGKLADQVFIALADNVGLHIMQSQPLGADGLDEGAQAVVGQVALSVGRRIEVNAVEDAIKTRVGLGDIADMGSELFADLVAQRADHRPHGQLRIFGLQRQVEAHELLVGLHHAECLCAAAHLGGNAVELIIKHIAQALGEDERQDIVLVLGGILRTADGAGGVPYPRLEALVRRRFAGSSSGLWSARFHQRCGWFGSISQADAPATAPTGLDQSAVEEVVF